MGTALELRNIEANTSAREEQKNETRPISPPSEMLEETRQVVVGSVRQSVTDFTLRMNPSLDNLPT